MIAAGNTRHSGGRLAGRWISLGLALCLALPLAVRAETPVNPLRQNHAPIVAPQKTARRTDPAIKPADYHAGAQLDDVWTQPAPALARSVVAANGEVPEPRSIVPPQFGQPEMLPAPRSIEGYPPGSFADPHFDPHVSGWQDYYVHRWFAEPWFSHSDPNDPYRHVGLGHPLTGTSWRNRPWFVGTFAGGVLMGDLIQDRVNANDTGFFGVRLGWDFDHYWGAEGRFAFAQPQLSDVNGLPLDRDAQNYFGDVSLVCYPWGDSCWRPYLSAGVGFQTLQFIDEHGRYVSEAPLAFPIGGGLKIFVSPWFTLRFDIVDNIAFGNDHVSLVNHFALMSGCELRFGGRPTSYAPWHGNTAYW